MKVTNIPAASEVLSYVVNMTVWSIHTPRYFLLFIVLLRWGSKFYVWVGYLFFGLQLKF